MIVLEELLKELPKEMQDLSSALPTLWEGSYLLQK